MEKISIIAAKRRPHRLPGSATLLTSVSSDQAYDSYAGCRVQAMSGEGRALDLCSDSALSKAVKRRKLPASARETLEKAALLGVEFSVPVLLSAGASPDGLDRLFDDGWLAEAGPNRARFASTRTTSGRSLPRFPGPGNGNGTRSWHGHAKRCVNRRAMLRITIWRHASSRLPGLCSFAPRKRLACNADFGRR